MLWVKARFVLVLLCLIATSGCTVKLAYNNLDRLVRWQVGDLVKMNELQRAYFDAELDRLLYWHRTTQLEEYAAGLERFSGVMAQEVELADIERVIEEALLWGQRVEDRTLSMMTPLLISLTDDQILELSEGFARSNEEFAEDEIGVSDAQAQARWRERVEDMMKFFSGRLNREQRDFLAAQSVRYQPEYVLWSEYRTRWQAALLDALEGRAQRERFAAQLRELADDRERFYGDEFSAVSEANEALGREVLVGLLARLSDRQTQRFREKLGSLAGDFRELAQAPVDEPGAVPCLLDCSES